jgi:pyruvate carboxylase
MRPLINKVTSSSHQKAGRRTLHFQMNTQCNPSKVGDRSRKDKATSSQQAAKP